MKNKNVKEPETDAEFEDAIEETGHAFIDHGDSFSVRYNKTGAITRLEADNLSDALFEAWNLVKD